MSRLPTLVCNTQDLIKAPGHTGLSGALHYKTQGLDNDAIGLQMDDASVARTTAQHTPFSALHKHRVGLRSMRDGFPLVKSHLVIHVL